MTTTLSGLRVYTISPGRDLINDISTEPEKAQVEQVFYSRRGNGPIYRWLYEAKVAHWRPVRMQTSDFVSRKLCNASWKTVPDSLQEQLGKHYLD